LRNIFDQYSQPENRVTHALMTALQEDRKLLGLFLRELVGVKPPCQPDKLTVLEQQYPGEEEPSEEELERRGIPDGWIFDSEGWCVFIESKVIAKLGADQINRHRRRCRAPWLQLDHRSCNCAAPAIHFAGWHCTDRMAGDLCLVVSPRSEQYAG
jgi:hypothetical protein